METLRLLKELEKLIGDQKTFIGVTYSLRQDDFLIITNKIRAAMPGLLSSEQVIEKTVAVLARHLHSQEEVAAIIAGIRAESNT
jgi:uncharacterized protein YunC (DUF1805 family)